MRLGLGIHIGNNNRLGANVNQKAPADFVSTFNVDTISADLVWTDTNDGKAKYLIYRSTNGGAQTLIATTQVGAISYSDAGCKQNASVVYRIKAEKKNEYVAATTLQTPLCWKSDQSTLTPVVINQVNVAAGKTVTINWGDGTSQALTGSTSNVTKNYEITGQKNIWLSGDTDSITYFQHYNQAKTYGNIGNWILPINIAYFSVGITNVTGDVSEWIIPSGIATLALYSTQLSGDISSWIIPAATILVFIYSSNISGSLPQISAHATNAMNFRADSCYFSGSNTTVFRKAMSVFNISAQNVPFPTTEIDKILKALADFYEVNAPTANCTISMNSSTNMGIPTGGSNNVDLLRLVDYYSAAEKSCIVVVRTA